jgi:hypothetical protein
VYFKRKQDLPTPESPTIAIENFNILFGDFLMWRGFYS